MAGLDPHALELLREQSGLSIDTEGRLCHRGEPITHLRTLEVLWGSLTRRDDGRYLVHVGRESGYVRVDDAPYGVRGVTFAGDGATLHLSDRTEEPLDPATLTLGADGVLRCRVKGGTHAARFTRSAQVELGLRMEEDRARPGAFVLHLGARTHVVAAG